MNYLAMLHHISLEKRKDSKFVREAVKNLYKSDIEKLKNRSIRGSKRNKVIKLPLTPEKVTTIKSLFLGRLSRVISTEDMETRCSQSYLNRLMSDAIGNILKKLSVRNVDNDMMADGIAVENEIV